MSDNIRLNGVYQSLEEVLDDCNDSLTDKGVEEISTFSQLPNAINLIKSGVQEIFYATLEESVIPGSSVKMYNIVVSDYSFPNNAVFIIKISSEFSYEDTVFGINGAPITKLDGRTYKANSVMTLTFDNGNLYYVDNQDNSATNTDQYKGMWNKYVDYPLGSIIYHSDGCSYIALQNVSKDTSPSDNPTYWRKITDPSYLPSIGDLETRLESVENQLDINSDELIFELNKVIGGNN